MNNSKILVVDDAEYMYEMLGEMLEGYELIKASNGIEAVEKYKEFKPDIVTMDIVMDKMDGIEAIKRIMEYDPKALILVISAIGDEDYLKKAVAVGAKGYLWKPFTVRNLLDLLDTIK